MRRTVYYGAVLALTFVSYSARATDTTWTFNGDGNWTETAKWSNGEPNSSSFNVFIDDGDSAVTVTLNATRTIGSISLGVDDTLTLQTLGSTTQTVTSANGFTNDGSILLTGTSVGTTNLILTSGTFTNSATGLIDFQSVGLSAQRQFSGDLVNNGTVTVNQTTTFSKSAGSYTNNGDFAVNGGSLSIGNGGTFQQENGTLDVNSPLALSSGSALNLDGGVMNMAGNVVLVSGTGNNVFTQNGGTINYTSGSVSGGTYRYLGGTINGTLQLGNNMTLEIGPGATNPAAFLFSGVNGSSALAGDVHPSQTLTMQSNGIGNFTLTSANGFTNDGSILLTGTNSGGAILTLTTGTLVNGATGLLHFDVGGTGSRSFTGDLVNNGTVTVDRATTFNKSGGSYTNNNQFSISNGLTVNNGGTLTQTAGTLDLNNTLTLSGNSALDLNGGTLNMAGSVSASGTGNAFTQNGGTLDYTSGIISGAYNYLGGTITGTPVLTSAMLTIGPAATNPAAFLFSSVNGNSALAGDIHASQTLTMQSNGIGNFTLTSANGFTNDGSIVLTGTNSGGAILALTTGTLTNGATGLLHFQTGGTGSRTFTGDLTNNGTVTVDRTTTFNKSGGSYTNNNQFTVGTGATLTINNGAVLTNFSTDTLTGGKYDIMGTFRFPSANIVTNQAEIILRGASSQILNDTGGANALANLATIGSAGTLRLYSGRNFTAAGAFTNDGTLELGDTTFTAPSLAISASGLVFGTGTLTSALTNDGLVRAIGGTLTVGGASVTNNGICEALDGSTLNVTVAPTNLGAGVLTAGTYRVVDGGGSATMTVSGTTAGTLAAGTTVELSGPNSTLSFGGSNLASSLTNNAGMLRIYNGRSFAMSNGLSNASTIELGGVGMADSTLTSSGTITNTATGTIFGHGTIASGLDNAGILQATGGTLSAQGPVGTSNGTFAADAGVTLDISGNISDGASSNGLAKTGAGTLNLSGTNSITGNLTVNQGIVAVTGGSTSVAGLFINRSGVTGLPSDLVVNGGAFTASAQSNIMGANTGLNGPGQFVLQSGSAAFNGGLKTSEAFGPSGGYIRVEGGTFSATDVNIVRNSAGTVDFASGWVITGGDSNVGIIELGSTNSNGALSVEGGTLTATGVITIARQSSPGRGGAMRVLGGTFTSTDATDGIILSRQDEGGNANQVASTSFSGGVSTVEKFKMGYDANVNAGSATITVNGGTLYIGSGGVEVNGSGTFAATMSLFSGTLGARTNWSGAANITLPTGGNMNIKAADATNLPHDITLNGDASGAGSLTKSGSGILTLNGSNTYGGTTEVESGTLVVEGTHTGGGDYAIDAGARLAGNGVIESNVHNTGTIAPGSSPGLLTIGALEMDSTATLQIELGGTTVASGYDRLVVQGAAQLDGTLAVSVIDGFEPAAGDSFDIFDWGSLSGTFMTTALPTLPTDLVWNTSQLYSAGLLSVRLAGDYNGDGSVDAADYVLWRKNPTSYGGDPDGYNAWRAHFGQTVGSGSGAITNAAVPEPASVAIAGMLVALARSGFLVRSKKLG